MSTEALPTPRHSNAKGRRAVVAASFGNALEWFDIIVYVFFGKVISKVFFPTSEGATGLILTFSVAAIAYFIRPLGAVVISHYSDRHGRKNALSLTIGLMTLGVLIMALAPSHATAGAWGAAIMILARLLQGFSAGGEFGSATAFMTENTEDKKAFYASWQVATQGVSMFLAAGFGWVLTTTLTPEQLVDFGWRIPYFFGLLIGPVGWYIRSQMEDTDDFAETEPVKVPIATAFAQHTGRILTAAGCVGVATLSVYLITYLPTYSQQNLHLPAYSGYVGATVAGLVTLVTAPLVGKLADRVGPVTVMVPTAIAGLVLAWPMFKLLTTTPTVAGLTVVEIIIGLLMSFYFAPLPALMSDMFPTNVRTTGMSVAYNIGVTLLGGLTPVVLASLVEKSLLAPSYYYMAIAVLSLICLVIARKVFKQR